MKPAGNGAAAQRKSLSRFHTRPNHDRAVLRWAGKAAGGRCGSRQHQINEALIRKAQELTRLKTKREIVDRALQLLVRPEARESILHYHG
jgi:hypothetical protein